MNRTFLITGATKGIGLATAKRLANKNHKIIGIARSKADDQFPGELFLADLEDDKASKEIFEQINQSYQIDGIVNNVGNSIHGRLEDISLTDFERLVNLNLKSALIATQIFTKSMINKKWGRIVNISSRAALGMANLSVYSAVKAAVIAFTRSWAVELAASGITVNAVAPGPTATDLFHKNRPKGGQEEAKIIETIAMKRLGTPDEIAAAIEFLLSEDASFITGQTIFVDGGGSIGKLSC